MSTENLPANIANLATGLAASVATVSQGSGTLYMKMSKTGMFVYGQEEVEVEDGSHWAANPAGFGHGWTAWGDKAHGTAGKNLGEKMGPASEPIFPESELPDVEGNWNKAVAIQFRCIDGEDKGVQVLFKSNSHGGRSAYGDLLEKVVEKIKAGDPAFVPICRLAHGSYKHDDYGKIYTPDFIVTDWVTMDGVPGDAEEVDAEEVVTPPPADDTPPKRKRKSKAAKAPEKAEEPEEDDVEEEEEDAPPPTKRRTRKRAA